MPAMKTVSNQNGSAWNSRINVKFSKWPTKGRSEGEHWIDQGVPSARSRQAGWLRNKRLLAANVTYDGSAGTHGRRHIETHPRAGHVVRRVSNQARGMFHRVSRFCHPIHWSG